jgi:predicted phage terminase large subunit-like protein
MSTTTEQLIRQLKLQAALLKRKAEQSLRSYVEQAWPILEPTTPFLGNWHINLIVEHLEAVTAGQKTRLLINVPPRYMKSLLVSVLWPTWEWITYPSRRWIFTSYSDTLSLKHSLDRRTLLQSDWYQARWGTLVHLADAHNVKGEFSNTARGTMIATSIGGSITGKGGDRIVIDDPHHPIQAESDVQREASLEYFRRTLSTRLDDKKRGAMVVVMQRLHEGDLSAFCLDGGDYTHICLPVEAETRTEIVFPRSGQIRTREPGDLLWPARDGRAELERQKRLLGAAGYAGQYQQQPVPAGGGLFKEAWFAGRFVDAAPVAARRTRGWDTAGTEGGGDWTCGVKIAEADGIFFVEDVRRQQLGPNGVDALIRVTAEMDGQACAQREEKEGGSAGGAVIAARAKTLVGFDYAGVEITGSKVTRGKPFRAQCEAGNVRIVRGTWNADYINELCGFPTARHDDQVDSSSCAFNAVLLEPAPFDWRATGMTSEVTW